MVELSEHLKNVNIISLYQDKFGLIIQTLYIVLQRAVNDNATTIEINDKKIAIKKDNNQLFQMTLETVPNGGKLHIDNMLIILKTDEIIRKYVTTSLQGDVLVCSIKH